MGDPTPQDTSHKINAAIGRLVFCPWSYEGACPQSGTQRR